MSWLISPSLVCLHVFVLCVCVCVCVIWNTPLHTHTSFSTLVFTQHWVENINWRQSVPRLQGLEEGLGSESWLSFQEVLFLTTLHKHWKRDPKKMTQTHYFHCKHTDVHILYWTHSHFSLICVSSLFLGRRLHILPKEHTVCQSVRTRKPSPDLCRSAASTFECRHVSLRLNRVLTVQWTQATTWVHTKSWNLLHFICLQCAWMQIFSLKNA